MITTARTVPQVPMFVASRPGIRAPAIRSAQPRQKGGELMDDPADEHAGEDPDDRAGLEHVARHRREAVERERDLDQHPQDRAGRRRTRIAIRRRHAAQATVSTARTQTVFGSSSWKRLIVPVILLP